MIVMIAGFGVSFGCVGVFVVWKVRCFVELEVVEVVKSQESRVCAGHASKYLTMTTATAGPSVS